MLSMKYIQKALEVNPEYTRQQKILDKIARDLGVVAFRPNYHAQDRDKNTVLFFTKEDYEHNQKLPDWAQNDKRAFWWFENTDVNGVGTYDFAKFGKIDLRGTDAHLMDVLKAEITSALNKHNSLSKKRRFESSVLKEFEVFKQKCLELEKIDIFNFADKISAYSEISHYLLHTDSDEIAKLYDLADPNVIELLCMRGLEYNVSPWASKEGIKTLIDDLIKELKL